MANATCVKQTEMPLIIFKKHSNSIEFQHELKRVNIRTIAAGLNRLKYLVYTDHGFSKKYNSPGHN